MKYTFSIHFQLSWRQQRHSKKKYKFEDHWIVEILKQLNVKKEIKAFCKEFGEVFILYILHALQNATYLYSNLFEHALPEIA